MQIDKTVHQITLESLTMKEDLLNLIRERTTDFVEFLTQKEEQKLVESAMKMSEKSFSKVWDNEEDAVYDKL